MLDYQLSTSETIVFPTCFPASAGGGRVTVSNQVELALPSLLTFSLKLPISLQLYATFSVCEEKLILCVFEFPQFAR